MFSNNPNLNYEIKKQIDKNTFFYSNYKTTRFGKYPKDTLDFKEYCEFKNIKCFITGVSIENFFRFSTQVPARTSYIINQKINQKTLNQFKNISNVIVSPIINDLNEFEYFLYFLLKKEGSTESHPFSLFIPFSIKKQLDKNQWNGFQSDYKPTININKVLKLVNKDFLFSIFNNTINYPFFKELNQYDKVYYYLQFGKNNKTKKRLNDIFNNRFHGDFCQEFSKKDLKIIEKEIKTLSKKKEKE